MRLPLDSLATESARLLPAFCRLNKPGVKNAALQFKTCIYKASDVPTATRRDNIKFAKPITCFEWQNVYVYDFDKARFETQLADFPGREKPAARVNIFLVITFVTLLAALALVACSRFGKFPSQKDY